MLESMTIRTSRKGLRNRHVGTPGHALKVRRTELGLTRKDVEDMTGGRITEKTLARYETGVNDLSVMSLSWYQVLLDVLQWTSVDFQRATGVQVGVHELPNSAPYHPTVSVPMLGTVSLGLRDLRTKGDTLDMRPIDQGLPGLGGRPVDKLRLVEVNRECLVSDAAAQGVPEGSMLVVELDAVPRETDVVAAWLPNRGAVVLKVYREGPDTVYRSLDPSGPVFRAQDEPLELRAVVRTVMYKPG
jgi:hypothetical protein